MESGYTRNTIYESFIDWYNSDEGNAERIEVHVQLDKMVRNHFGESLQIYHRECQCIGTIGADYIVMWIDGNYYRCGIDWYEEQSVLYKEGVGAAVNFAFSKILDTYISKNSRAGV